MDLDLDSVIQIGFGFKGTLDLGLDLDSLTQIGFGYGFGFKGTPDLDLDLDLILALDCFWFIQLM